MVESEAERLRREMEGLRRIEMEVDRLRRERDEYRRERDIYQAIAVTIVEERLPPSQVGIVRLEAARDFVEALKEKAMAEQEARE